MGAVVEKAAPVPSTVQPADAELPTDPDGDVAHDERREDVDFAGDADPVEEAEDVEDVAAPDHYLEHDPPDDEDDLEADPGSGVHDGLGGEAAQDDGGRWSAEQALDGILAEPAVAVAAPPRRFADVVQDAPLSSRAELRVDFGAHLEANYRRLVAQLYAITLDPAEAHAVVQDAYSRAWRSWGPVSRSVDPTGWVRRVAVRSTVRSWRRWRRTAPHPVGGPGPDTRTGALLAALRQLSPAERRCVVLHHMVGSPVREIAAVEAVSIGTIAARLARAQQIVTDAVVDGLADGFEPDAASGPDPWAAPAWDESAPDTPAVAAAHDEEGPR